MDIDLFQLQIRAISVGRRWSAMEGEGKTDGTSSMQIVWIKSDPYLTAEVI